MSEKRFRADHELIHLGLWTLYAVIALAILGLMLMAWILWERKTKGGIADARTFAEYRVLGRSR